MNADTPVEGVTDALKLAEGEALGDCLIKEEKFDEAVKVQTLFSFYSKSSVQCFSCEN